VVSVRVLSHQASAVVKHEGKYNDLIERIKKDEFFKPIWGEIDALMDPATFVGRASRQVEKFVDTEVKQALEPSKAQLSEDVSQLNV
jgi:adenylosuccinate lyase